MKSEITIHDLARRTGVSATTVSLILNGKAAQYRISPVTAQRVTEIANRSGFRPDFAARAFRTGNSKTIGLVVSDITNPFSAELAKAVEREASLKNLRLIIANTDDSPNTESIVIKNLAERRVDGLIVSSVRESTTISELSDRPLPVVHIDRTRHSAKGLFVTSNNRQGMKSLSNHLISEGCRKIAFIGGIPHLSTHQERIDGFRESLREHGITFSRSLYANGGFTGEWGYENAKKIITDSPRPDALITASCTLFIGALRWLHEKFGTVPSWLSLGTFDDHPMLDFLPYPVASVKQDCDGLSAAALQLISTAFDNHLVHEERIIEPQLIIRKKLTSKKGAINECFQ